MTVVSGVPRSGTSLMMQMLRAAGLPLLVDDARPSDASNPAGYFEYAPVRRTEKDPGWVADAAGRVVKVIHALLPHLPRDRAYRVVWMERPASEIEASQDRMLERLEGVKPESSDGRIARVLARQQGATRELLEREACFAWCAVDYPELIAAPDEALAVVAGFLGIEHRIADMKACIDPALYRERA